MRSSPSSSCSTLSSSSSYSLSATSLIKRLETIFKKAYELSTLCEVEVCVIHYGPDGELKTWPEDREKVKDMALRYSQLDDARKRKKSVNLYGCLKEKKKTTTIFKKNTNVLKYPISDHYSPDQISQLIQSLELAFSTLQERLRLVEAQKQKETNLDHQKQETKLDHQGLTMSLNLQDHQSLTPPMSRNLQDHHQTQSLNPSQFSLFMYNHGDATLSQIPLSAASIFDQSVSTQFTNYTAVQESGLKNHLMHQELNGYDQNNNFQHLCVSNTQDYSASGLKNQLKQKELYGYDQNMCLSNINSNNFQHPCVSNMQDYSVLLAVQESVNNYGLNQSMQHEMYGYDQNMCMRDSTTSNSQHPYELCSEFQDPYSYMVSNTTFPQDMSTSYDVQFGESSLLHKSTPPSSLYTTPNSYFHSDNSENPMTTN